MNDHPADTMRERADQSRLGGWVLLSGDRWVIATAVLGVYGLGVLAAAAFLPERVLIEIDDPIETLFQALVTTTITSVTLVVSINSLVLSQELGPLGDQHDRIAGAMSFRRDVEDELGVDVTAATPAGLLRELVTAASDRARALSSTAGATIGDDERVTVYAEELEHHAAATASALSGAQFGSFGVVSAALNFNYSWKIYEARRLRAAFGSATSDGNASAPEPTASRQPTAPEVAEALDDVVSVLLLFGAAREHVKTLYFQSTLVELSRAMLYTAVPSLVVATNVLLFHGVLGTVSATTLGIAHYVWIVAVASAIALAPFAILLSFVLRIGTVAKRTLSIGPLILRATDGEVSDRTDADE